MELVKSVRGKVNRGAFSEEPVISVVQISAAAALYILLYTCKTVILPQELPEGNSSLLQIEESDQRRHLRSTRHQEGCWRNSLLRLVVTIIAIHGHSLFSRTSKEVVKSCKML